MATVPQARASIVAQETTRSLRSLRSATLLIELAATRVVVVVERKKKTWKKNW